MFETTRRGGRGGINLMPLGWESSSKYMAEFAKLGGGKLQLEVGHLNLCMKHLTANISVPVLLSFLSVLTSDW